MRPFIIAEISANHLGDKTRALELIKVAKEAGADAVKTQCYSADSLSIDCRGEIFLNSPHGPWAGTTLYELYQSATTPGSWQKELQSYALELGIEFFSTPYDYAGVDFLVSLGVKKIKISSFEAMDFPLISYAAKFGLGMIISTGVSSLAEIEEAISTCKRAGNSDITILKCVSSYPAKHEEMNLATIADMKARFAGIKVGLSDHSLDIIAPVVACALGASVIEKHLCLDRALGGADSSFSLNPQEFSQMVSAVRSASLALGVVDYSVEAKNRIGARSLFAVSDIARGESFSAQNIRSIRPANGLHPKYYPDILGKRATQDIKRGEPLKAELIDGFSEY